VIPPEVKEWVLFAQSTRHSAGGSWDHFRGEKISLHQRDIKR